MSEAADNGDTASVRSRSSDGSVRSEFEYGYWKPRQVGRFHYFTPMARSLADPKAYAMSKRRWFMRKGVQAVLDSINASNHPVKKKVEGMIAEDLIPGLERGEFIETYINHAFSEFRASDRSLSNLTSEEIFKLDLQIEERIDRRIWSWIDTINIYSDDPKDYDRYFPCAELDDWDCIRSNRHSWLASEINMIEAGVHVLLLMVPYIHFIAPPDKDEDERLIFDYSITRQLHIDDLLAALYVSSADHVYPDYGDLDLPKYPLRWALAELIENNRWLEYAFYDRYLEEFNFEPGAYAADTSLKFWLSDVGWSEIWHVQELFDADEIEDVKIYRGTRGTYAERTVGVWEDGKIVERTILEREADEVLFPLEDTPPKMAESPSGEHSPSAYLQPLM